MRTKTSRFGWSSAVAAAAAMVVAGAVYASADDQVAAGPDVNAYEPELLHELLLPAEDHPVGEVVEFSFEEATQTGLFGLPDGMVMRPEQCVGYLAPALGEDPGSANGWYQMGPVDPEQRQAGFFASWVVEVPGGADVDAILAAARTCQEGTVTLAGHVSGRVGNAEQEPLALDGAATVALRQRVEFDPPQRPADEQVLTQYYGPSPDGVHSATDVELVSLGDVLIMVLSTDPELADEAAGTMYERARERDIG